MNHKKIVAIHQPNFFPWLGFFNKYIHSDIFIIADSVQQPKSHGGWSNRVFLLLDKEKKYLTLPLSRQYRGLARVNEIRILKTLAWEGKTLKTIEFNYRKAPFFEEIYPIVKEAINYETDYLWEFNLNAIEQLLHILVPGTNKIILQSSLHLDHLWKTDLNNLIIEMVKKVGGTVYLSGDGSDSYQNEQPFLEKNIDILYTRYKHPVYQHFASETFYPGLSIIDPLMNLGKQGTRDLLIENARIQKPQE